MQVRSIETLSSMLDAMGRFDVPTEHSAALNERDYGEYTGKSKWDMEKLIGTDEWNKVRREWDYPVPCGETLKMVYRRAVPFFEDKILPAVRKGENVLVVSHGNAIRALVKRIEGIPDEGAKDIEMIFGSILIYEVGADGAILGKEVRKVDSSVNA
jgi:2,3-bisphosphoglycerate-dependent phosphoglycerate mutase